MPKRLRNMLERLRVSDLGIHMLEKHRERARVIKAIELSERKGFWPEARTVRKKSLETTRTIDL